MTTIDALITPPVRFLAAQRPVPPVLAALAPARRAALAEVLPPARRAAAPFAEGLRQGDPAVAAAFAALAERSLAAFHAAIPRLADGGRARPSRAVVAALHALDLRFHRCETMEHMDDPALPSGLRSRLVQRLHRLNLVLGSYEAFFRGVEPFLRQGGAEPGRPVRLLELAAGAGGFSLWLAREARRRGLRLEVIATDLEVEFLRPAAERARAEGLPLRVQALDALRLQDYPEAVDIVVCAQAIHHFPTGLLAHLFHCAADRARRGVVFVDGCRSALLGGAFVGLGALRYADPAFLHDAWVSFRRFYVPEELALLCGLGPHGEGVTARHVGPGHCLVTRTTPGWLPAPGRPAETDRS